MSAPASRRGLILGLAAAPFVAATPPAVAGPDDAFVRLMPTLLPLLDEYDVLWAEAQRLYRVAERMAGPRAARLEQGRLNYEPWSKRWDEARDRSGYSAAWDLAAPFCERINALVEAHMEMPSQTLDGVLLKRRLGLSLEHYEGEADEDLALLWQARRCA